MLLGEARRCLCLMLDVHKNGDRMSRRTQASITTWIEFVCCLLVCVIVVGAIKLDSKQIKGTMNGQANYVCLRIGNCRGRYNLQRHDELLGSIWPTTEQWQQHQVDSWGEPIWSQQSNSYHFVWAYRSVFVTQQSTWIAWILFILASSLAPASSHTGYSSCATCIAAFSLYITKFFVYWQI